VMVSGPDLKGGINIMKFNTVQGVDLSINSFKSLAAACILAGLLTACVTTTTGGFNVDTSDEQAVQDYIQLALAYYEADDMLGARRHVNNALAINPDHADTYNLLALISQREGDLDIAEQNFLRAIRLDRTNSRARNNYAALLFGLQRFEDAFEQLQVVANDIEYDGRAIAFGNLGRSAERIGRESEAENAFTRALQLNSNLYVSALELSMLKLKRGDEIGARQNYQQYLTIVEFYKLPHTPRALLAGIQIGTRLNEQKMVDDFALILGTLYQESPEYQTYRSLSDAN